METVDGVAVILAVDRGSHADRHNDCPAIADEQHISAANVSHLAEYDPSMSSMIMLLRSTISHGCSSQTGSEFGP